MTTDTPTEDLTGQPFHKWTVEQYLGKQRHKSPSGGTHVTDLWLCRCQCGAKQSIQKGNLVNDLSTKCRQCMYEERRRWPTGTPSRARNFWNRHHGELCEEWRDSGKFLAWWLLPRAGRNLRRRDTSKPYSPDNCYWSNHQARGDAFRERLAKLRQRVTGETIEQAEAWMDGVSKQRMYQFWHAHNDQLGAT